MQIRQEIAERYWLGAAIEEAASNYAAQGYEVTQDAPIGTLRADLVARKGDELIVVVFKLGAWSHERNATVRQMRNEVVHRLGGKFNLVVVTPPREKNIEIEGIENTLYNIFLNKSGELHELSTQAQVEEVSDVTITSVDVEQNHMRVAGVGVVSVALDWDTGSDIARGNGKAVSDSFPFDFTIVLDNNLNVLEVEAMRVNTSV